MLKWYVKVYKNVHPFTDNHFNYFAGTALLSCDSSLLNQTQTNTVKVREIHARVEKLEAGV